MPPPLIGGVQPFAELARGRAAAVYKGVERESGAREGQAVLLKVLTDEAASDPTLVAWFEGEARLLADVRHPNVVALHRAGQEGGRPYLVAEFVEGRSFADLLAERGALPPPLAAFVAAETARGLAAAHARGVLHRDLKPPNVLVGHDGRVKLTDFGLATRVAPQPAPAEAGGDGAPAAPVGVRGTLGYLAPEAVGGAVPGPEADVFALGALLAEALTGRPAFPARTTAEALDAALHHDPTPTLAADPRLPDALVAVVARLLDKRPAARPSAAEAAVLLDGLARGAEADALAGWMEGTGDHELWAVEGEAWGGEDAPEAREGGEVERDSRKRKTRALAWAAVLAVVGTAAFVAWPRPEQRAAEGPVVATDRGAERPLVLSDAPADSGAADALVPDASPLEPALPPVGAEPQPSLLEPPAPSPRPPVVPAPSSERPAAPSAEPAETPAPPRAGTLVVAVEPWAEVFVDGQRVGQGTRVGPLTLAAGTHRVVFRKPDFPDHTESVVVAPGEEARVSVPLWSTVGRFSIEIHPWAEVFVDGRSWGTIPPQTRPLILAPGPHVLRLVHPQLGAYETTIRAAAGETRTLRFNLDHLIESGEE